MDALVVASTRNRQHVLTDVLYREQICCVVCSTAAEARRESLRRPFDLFVIYGGLIDELGTDLAITLSDANDCGGLFIDEGVRIEQIETDLNNCGIIALPTPVTKGELLVAVRLILVSNARVRALKLKNEELRGKLEDMKFIHRAKIVLMRSLGYSEEQAHKFIEQKSMDMRVSRREVAKDILKMYEAI